MRDYIMNAIEESVEALPKDQKEVFIMNEFEDLSFNEISERTGIGVNTLLSRKRYAVIMLRNKLKELYNLINT
jgi:DNA-directed RNA polymerase specialized sigma24 family protein